MKSATKILLLMVLFVSLNLAVVISFRALSSESTIRLRSDAVSILVLRSIQLGRFDHIFDVSTYPGIGYNGIPRRVSENPFSINCQDRISLGDVDPSESIPIVTLFQEHSNWTLWPGAIKWKAVAIYEGSPADLDIILKAKDPELLFVDPSKMMDGTPVAERHQTDNSAAYDAFIKSRRLRWNSNVCETFTYTIIEEY